MTEPTPEIREQILDLAYTQCSGIITEAEMETLENLLITHPEYCREYLNYVVLNIGLSGTAQARLLEAPATIKPSNATPLEVKTDYLVMFISVASTSAGCTGIQFVSVKPTAVGKTSS
ncbi:hypothetical protein V6x_52410 [Gimesia chilikensis]|uniref:Uncharacterized protein n=1 Tax=Gimesia chilikensis TaxID=2605989 RepID=A0A517WJS4_9PLAN|nr:hypothetical protein [Gimesia chilikensis]QDU05504.1 hypothetical protein V6x_52410 [Gimesia chilikensis]